MAVYAKNDKNTSEMQQCMRNMQKIMRKTVR